MTRMRVGVFAQGGGPLDCPSDSRSMTRRNVVVAVDPAKHWGPVHLGARIAHMLDAPMVVISVFPHHDLLDRPEDEEQRRIREQAERDLRELARGLPGVEAADAKVLAGSSPAR